MALFPRRTRQPTASPGGRIRRFHRRAWTKMSWLVVALWLSGSAKRPIFAANDLEGAASLPPRPSTANRVASATSSVARALPATKPPLEPPIVTPSGEDDDAEMVEEAAPLEIDPTTLIAGDLPIRWNPHTARYLRFFRDHASGRARVRSWLSRLGRFEAVMRRILVQEGLPSDLVYLVAIESSFDPQQRSFAGAAGLWQFMPTTARAHGLRVDHWVDERLHVERSTHAAARYLAALKERFGNWELALAAYNAGFGVILATVARHQTNNFWALCEIESGLPFATVGYIPKVLALALADHNPKLLPFAVQREEARPSTGVSFPATTTLREIARELHLSESVLIELNPHLLRKRVPPDRKLYPVEIPPAHVAAAQALATAKIARRSPHRQHVLRLGEDIDDLALALALDPVELRQQNGLSRQENPTTGTTLLLPAQAGPLHDRPRALFAALPPLDPPADFRLVLFEVRENPPLNQVARALNVPTQHLVAWNDLDPSAFLWSGQVLQALVPRQQSLDSTLIRVFEADAIPRVRRGSAEHLDRSAQMRGLERRGHVVRRGDSLKKLAKRYQLSVGSLARINSLKRDAKLEPGQTLVVYTTAPRRRTTVAAPSPQVTPSFGKGIARTTQELARPSWVP